MTQLKIVQNELGEYGIKILDSSAIHPLDNKNGMLVHKRLLSDHPTIWFMFRWDAERIMKRKLKEIARTIKNEIVQAEYNRKKNTIVEYI